MQTEINERGPEISEQEVEIFIDKLLYLARGARICVLAGSLPPGVDQHIYAELITELRKLNVFTVVDTDGEVLRQAVRAEPNLVSPNVLEAEELVGHEFNDEADREQSMQEIIELGANEAIITLPDGCVAQLHKEGGEQLYRANIETREPLATVGSGDAFIAGYVAAYYAAKDPVECLRFGVACGTESVQHYGAGVFDPQAAKQLIDEVSVQELESSGVTGVDS